MPKISNCAIRWTVRDRKTGYIAEIPHPIADEERETLANIIHNSGWRRISQKKNDASLRP